LAGDRGAPEKWYVSACSNKFSQRLTDNGKRMQVDFDEKQIILDKLDFKNPSMTNIAMNQILSVMFYPKSEEDQSRFHLGYKNLWFKNLSKVEKFNFNITFPESAGSLAMYGEESEKYYIAVMSSRQGGEKAGLFMKGMIAGTLLQYIAQSQPRTLEEAYKMYHQWPQCYFDEAGNEDPVKRSNSSLRKHWDDFLPVLHLWAAYSALAKDFRQHMVDTSTPIPTSKFIMFLNSANHWRNFLLDLPDASYGGESDKYLVKDLSQVWGLVSTYKIPPPIPSQ